MISFGHVGAMRRARMGCLVGGADEGIDYVPVRRKWATAGVCRAKIIFAG
jgi:hypothetical protein